MDIDVMYVAWCHGSSGLVCRTPEEAILDAVMRREPGETDEVWAKMKTEGWSIGIVIVPVGAG